MAQDGHDSIIDAERAESIAEARDHVDERHEERCSNDRNHKYGYCHECGLGMST